MPCDTYADVKRRAALIATVTRNRYMPPWKADPSNGPFVGQHPLSDAEIALIAEWAAGGAIEGDPSDPRPAEAAKRERPVPPKPRSGEGDREPASGWQLGTPDLVVTPTAPYTLQADGTDVFRIFVLPIAGLDDALRPGPRVPPGQPEGGAPREHPRRHHTRGSRRLDEADPAPGYSGLIARAAHYPEGHFLGWTPGQVAPLLAEAISRGRLERDTDLVVEIHMQPSGKPESVQPSIGLYFGDAAPTRTPAMLRLGRQNIDIPPGDQRYTITDSYLLPVDVRGGGPAAARALPRPRRPRRGDAAGRLEARAHSHPGLGFPLAARLPLRHAVRLPKGTHAVDASTATTTPRRTRATPSGPRSARAGVSDRRTRWATSGSRC